MKMCKIKSEIKKLSLMNVKASVNVMEHLKFFPDDIYYYKEEQVPYHQEYLMSVSLYHHIPHSHNGTRGSMGHLFYVGNVNYSAIIKFSKIKLK